MADAPRYVLLNPGDVIQEGDECYDESSWQWKPVSLSIGNKWAKDVLPIRRLDHHAAELAALRAERDAALDRVEELEAYQEEISVEFEKELWVAVRKLLNETNYDWEYQPVTVDMAYEHLSEELRARALSTPTEGTAK